MNDYRYNKHSVSMLNYHLLWITRRRKEVLIDKVKDRLNNLLREKAIDLDIKIILMEIRPDYVHLFINASPELAVYQLVCRLKSYTANILRKEFPELRKIPSIWTRNYFTSTEIELKPKIIQKYIESQSKK